jgi:hypothetical protein
MGSPCCANWSVPSLGVVASSYGPNTGLVLATLRKT